MINPPPVSRLSVAPMMEWTDRHCRFFHRLLSRRTLLYTEMVTAAAIRHGDRDRLLGFDPAEHPAALQLGGSDPEMLAEAARVGADYGYDEINLNVGCPSDRVQSGRFGACLMAEPELVARCCAAMADALGGRISVTVKCRIAIDDMDEWPTLKGFVDQVAAGAGVTRFIVHARKAWLQGLSPKENRSVPPLRYDLVYRLKTERPDLTIDINGGVTTLDAAQDHLNQVDGVMIGRAAYETPEILLDADRRIYGAADGEPADLRGVIQAMADYAENRRQADGAPLSAITRHMLGLFQGRPGARAWRRYLSENAHLPGATPQVLLDAAARVLR